MNQINTEGVLLILEAIAQKMKDQKEYLIELDSQIGDGDLGITMEKGFSAAYEYAQEQASLTPGALLGRCGMQIARTAPSTMGTLMGTGFMRGGKALGDAEVVSSTDIIQFFEAFLQGVIERGKAKPGDKTIIDVLIPAVEEMKAYQGTSIQELLGHALNGAKKGLEHQKGMMSQHGKAAVFRDKTKQMTDPGSMAVVFLIEAWYEGVLKKERETV